MDELNASFQDPKKSLSKLADTANKTLSVLEQSRTDGCWSTLFKLTLRHKEMIDCVGGPTMFTTKRRRTARNYNELNNHHQTDGATCIGDDTEHFFRAKLVGKPLKISVKLNGVLESHPIPGKHCSKNHKVTI